MKGTLFLMYHELRMLGRELCSDDPGYQRYVVNEDEFRSQMQVLSLRSKKGLSVSEWLDEDSGEDSGVVLTFDDGCETDLLFALPILRAEGFNATCYLTVDFLNRRGYLSDEQVRELYASGIEIGCHSRSHAFLNDVDDATLLNEVVNAKTALEQMVGGKIRSFSCPGGRYDSRLLPLAYSVGYDSVVTSDVILNQRNDPRPLLGRVPVTAHMDRRDFDAIVDGNGLFLRRSRQLALNVVKTLLGNGVYARFHDRAHR